MLASLPTILLFAACTEGPQSETATPSRAGTPPAEDRNFEARSYERDVVFLTTDRDSLIIVPWVFEASTQPGGVVRHLRGWLARSGIWDPFFSAEWGAPPTRAPWRILPRGPVRLTVGPQGALESIIFEEGARQLELTLGEVRTEWTGPTGTSVRVHEGAALLANERIEGIIIDLNRAWPVEEERAINWFVLVSGDTLQVILEAATPQDGADPHPYRGWARRRVQDLTLPVVMMEWGEVRSFEPARRNVPFSWTLRSQGDEVAGSLNVLAAHVSAGSGEGPRLPVDAVFEIAGTLMIQGDTFAVRGLARHYER